jgi:hypothetical protein
MFFKADGTGCSDNTCNCYPVQTFVFWLRLWSVRDKRVATFRPFNLRYYAGGRLINFICILKFWLNSNDNSGHLSCYLHSFLRVCRAQILTNLWERKMF